jgi:hypothetical protein
VKKEREEIAGGRRQKEGGKRHNVVVEDRWRGCGKRKRDEFTVFLQEFPRVTIRGEAGERNELGDILD